VAALNAIVLVAACAVTIVVVSPQKLSSIAVGEAVVLLAALVLVAAINLYLLRRALGPLEALTALARRVDLTRPGQRVPVSPYESEISELATTFNEMLERLESERRESTRRVLDAQESERLRVSRELHDEVGQTLTAVLLQLGRIAKHAPPELAPELEDAQERARETLEEVRRISRELRPEMLEHLGLISALTELSSVLSRRAGIRIDRDFPDALPPLAEEVELAVYRVAQESLTNVIRHANASHVSIRLEQGSGSVVLTVSDDGRGFPNGRAPGEHGGIRGMRERSLLVGGALAVKPGPNGGVEVRLEVPTANEPAVER
jgi:two-component system sensor histidine kinase UhpB